MSLCEVPLGDISTELFSPRDIASCSTLDYPLVVIEEAGRFLLVDGYKRFFALRAEGGTSAWAIVKPWSRSQGKLQRLRLNNPTRRTSLREELVILEDLHKKEGLSPHAIARGLGRKKSWVTKRHSRSSSAFAQTPPWRCPRASSVSPWPRISRRYPPGSRRRAPSRSPPRSSTHPRRAASSVSSGCAAPRSAPLSGRIRGSLSRGLKVRGP